MVGPCLGIDSCRAVPTVSKKAMDLPVFGIDEAAAAALLVGHLDVASVLRFNTSNNVIASLLSSLFVNKALELSGVSASVFGSGFSSRMVRFYSAPRVASKGCPSTCLASPGISTTCWSLVVCRTTTTPLWWASPRRVGAHTLCDQICSLPCAMRAARPLH